MQSVFSLRHNLATLCQRPTGHEPLLDGIRALAVVIVTVTHLFFFSPHIISDASDQFDRLPGWITWPNGGLGVDMFFVLSGFLIGGLLLREYRATGALQLGRFFLRRSLRLMPMYWLTLALSLLWVLSHPAAVVDGPRANMNPGAIWQNLLYVNNFFRRSETFGPMRHSWSLAVEEQFYLLLPLLLLVFFRTRLRAHPGKVLLALTGLYLVTRLVCRIYALHLFRTECGFDTAQLATLGLKRLAADDDPLMSCVGAIESDVMYDNLYTKYITLLGGVAGAYLQLYRPALLQRWFASSGRSAALLVGALGVIVATFGFSDAANSNKAWMAYQGVLGQLVFSAAMVALILGGLHARDWVARSLRMLLGSRVTYVIAQFSYSIYLCNLGLVKATYALATAITPSRNLVDLWIVALPILALLSAAVGLAAYLLVERPFIELGRRWRPQSLAERNAASLSS